MYQVPNVSRYLWSAATVKNKNIENAWMTQFYHYLLYITTE
jgi:hypothetical protein